MDIRRIIFTFLVIVVLVAPLVSAVPAWKKQQPPEPTPEPTPEPVEEENGINWEAIGVIIIVVGAGVGWFITKKKRGLTSKYLKEINNAFETLKDNPGKCEIKLYSLKDKIEEQFIAGKITEQSYALLEGKIENYVKGLRKGFVKKRFELTSKIKKELDEMLADGIITEEEYKRYVGLDKKDLSWKDKNKLDTLMRKWKDKDKSRLLRNVFKK
jgi:hypothetical protein